MAKLKFKSLAEIDTYIYNMCSSAYPYCEFINVQIYNECTNAREVFHLGVFIGETGYQENDMVLEHYGNKHKDINDCIIELIKALYPVPEIDEIEYKPVININTDGDE